MSVNTTKASPTEQISNLPETTHLNIAKRLFLDALAALTAACSVSPIVAAVDK